MMKITRDVLKEYLCILVGAFILASGMSMFLLPCKISSGGIGAVGTVLFYLFKIPLSVTNLFFNVILFIAGYKFFGKDSVVKTAAGILLLSLFLEITDRFVSFGSDMFISMVIGGMLVGIGVGFVVRVGASTGGSDFAALIVKRFFPHMSVAAIILIIDCVIIIFSGIIFKSYMITFYSAIAMYISSKTTDAVVNMGDATKCIFIISHKSEEIANIIMGKFERGVTGIYSKGMYSGQDDTMLLCVVAPKELPRVVQTVRKTDPYAFAITADSREVFGEGFKEKTEYDKLYAVDNT